MRIKRAEHAHFPHNTLLLLLLQLLCLCLPSRHDKLAGPSTTKLSQNDQTAYVRHWLPLYLLSLSLFISVRPILKVHVEGMKVEPLKDFAAASMPAEVMKYVTVRGWEQPTLIQAHCWPVLNSGRDVIGIAETGSGKTLGFSLPAMSKIFNKMKVSFAELVVACVGRPCLNDCYCRASVVVLGSAW